MRYQIPAPKSWQDFEELCLRLWRDIWGDPNAQKNGRGGQEQNGVDVFGVATYDGKNHGVQCKGKNANYGSQLTTDEIKNEANNADGFKYNLSTFTMATTSARDAKLQEYCRELNDAKAHSFTVDVWAWDDIEEEIQYRTEILDHLKIPYDDSEQDSPSLKISALTGKDRLMAFLTRPIIKEVTSLSMRELLHNVLDEVIKNAFMHGHAKLCLLLYNDYCFTVIDNGSKYDASTLIENDGQGGAMTLRRLKGICGESLTFKYEYKKEEKESKNVFSMQFSAEALKTEVCNIVEFFVTESFNIQNRTGAIQRAISDMGTLEDNQIASVIFGNIVSLSGITAYAEKAAQIVGAERLKISVPIEKGDFEDRLKEITPNITIR